MYKAMMKISLLICLFLHSASSFDILNPLKSSLRPFNTTNISDQLKVVERINNESQHLRNNSKEELESSPMEILFAKNEAARESLLNNLFEMNSDILLQPKNPNPSDSDKTKEENNIIISKTDENEENTFYDIFKELHFLPITKGKPHKTNIRIENDSELLKHIDSLRKDAWNHFKSIVKTYINTFDDDQHTLINSMPMKLLLKTLEMGDGVNIIHLLGKRVDPEIFSFMKDKLKPLSASLLNLTNTTEILANKSMTSTLNRLTNDVAWMAMRYIIDDLLKKVNKSVSKKELYRYIETLKKTNPFAAKGMEFVLSFPSENPEYNQEGEGRSYKYKKSSSSGRDDYGYDDLEYSYRDKPSSKDYGHKEYDHSFKDHGHKEYDHSFKDHGHKDYGGYGAHSGSHYEMKGKTLDPYLILAGIGAAALLAYVAYMVLTTEAPPDDGDGTDTGPVTNIRKKRGLGGPQYVSVNKTSFVINSIDEMSSKYDLEFVQNVEEIIEIVNSFWKLSHQSDPCIKCLVKSQFPERAIRKYYFSSILTSSLLSYWFEMPRTGHMIDNALNEESHKHLELLQCKKMHKCFN